MVDSGCPDVVTLQEVSQAVNNAVDDQLLDICPGAYRKAYEVVNGFDDAIILSRDPLVDVTVKPLFGIFAFRHVLSAKVDRPGMPVRIFTTHLASNADFGSMACDDQCPEVCKAAQAATIRDCQAVELRSHIDDVRRSDEITLVTGDFNAEPGSFVYRQFANAEWKDTFLAADNPECDPTTGRGCTSGRDDESLVDLERPDAKQRERIDFAFLASGTNCAAERVSADDGDRAWTGIFPPRANEACGPSPREICWPSDHDGVIVDLQCE